jgi:hypothetical protein
MNQSHQAPELPLKDFQTHIVVKSSGSNEDALLSFVDVASRELLYNGNQSSHLAYFVVKIATPSFSPHQILLVSSSEYDDTVNKMLKCVRQYALWHINVSRPGNLALRGLKEQDHKIGSYVMFTTGAEDAVSQAEGLMDSTSWNTRALFLVVVRTPTTRPEH